MDVFIKLAPKDFNLLRSQIPAQSAAHEAIERATPIGYSLDGVLFAGYTIPCNEEQARICLEIAKQCCPEIVPHIEQAITCAPRS